MAQQFKVAAFDLDGTLLDTSVGVLESVKYTIRQFGLKMLMDEELKSFIGPPIQKSFAEHYGLKGAILQEIATVFRNQYKKNDLLKAKPYDGIYEVFDSLVKNDVKPVIATYKRQDYAVEILKHFGFDQYTDIMYGADHDNKLTKKDIIEKAIIDTGIAKYSNAVMVGDSDNDAIGAIAIGTKFVGVTYGFGFKTKRDVEKYFAYGIADKPIALKSILIGEET